MPRLPETCGGFEMRVMIADYDAPIMGWWAAHYPDKIGWLVGPVLEE